MALPHCHENAFKIVSKLVTVADGFQHLSSQRPPQFAKLSDVQSQITDQFHVICLTDCD